jgi:hypothetical protein
MSKTSVEVIYGKRSKFEIFRVSKALGGYEFDIHKDGKFWKSGYSSLERAVQVAREQD